MLRARASTARCHGHVVEDATNFFTNASTFDDVKRSAPFLMFLIKKKMGLRTHLSNTPSVAAAEAPRPRPPRVLPSRLFAPDSTRADASLLLSAPPPATSAVVVAAAATEIDKAG